MFLYTVYLFFFSISEIIGEFCNMFCNYYTSLLQRNLFLMALILKEQLNARNVN